MYIQRKPQGWLSEYIDTFWYYKNDRNETLNFSILPDGRADIVFEDGFMKPEVVGCMTHPLDITIARGDISAGIGLKPGCASAFLKTPLSEFTDLSIPYDLISKDRVEFDEKIAVSPSHEKIFREFERFLSSIFQEAPYDKTSLRATQMISRSGGILPVSEVAKKLNISRRHLERLFREEIGIPPKQFSRIVRYQNARYMLKSGKFDHLSQIAAESGYFDQSHFYKDYKDLTGNYPEPA
ncbi:MAG: hypothetical protein A2Y33_13695 [Spirochaetes bacterium GWF1_51_8]|nr:MAG: hypothetical protein A2Y33_13695 [Spirochaetes bacterium GWF1_51_8]